MLRSFCHERHTLWPNMLNSIEDCLNNVVNLSTGFSPMFLQKGIKTKAPMHKLIKFPEEAEVIIPREVVLEVALDNMRTRAEKRADKANKNIKPINLDIGDAVLIRTHCQSSAHDRTIKKFFLIYEGPYYVLDKAGPNSYIVGNQDGTSKSKQNIVNIKNYKFLSEQ